MLYVVRMMPLSTRSSAAPSERMRSLGYSMAKRQAYMSYKASVGVMLVSHSVSMLPVQDGKLCCVCDLRSETRPVL